MYLLKVFHTRSRFFYTALLLLGIINSVTYSFLLLFVNKTISGEPIPLFPEYDWAIFSGLLLISIVSTKIFQSYIVKLTQDILYDYELNLLEKLRVTAYFDFQKLGSQRVYTAINDVRVLSIAPEVLVIIINSVVVILCALAYMCWVSPLGGLAMIGIMIGVLAFYVLRNNRIRKDINKVRDLQDSYYKYLQDLLNGFKEIKMSITRNNTLFGKFLKVNRITAKSLGKRAAMQYLDNELIGRYSWYIALGLVIFVLPRITEIGAAEVVPFIVVVLYLMGPLSALVGIVTHINNIHIAVDRIEKLEKDIRAGENIRLLDSSSHVLDKHFKSLRFEQIVFEYFDENQNKTFKLGPIDLEITGGETIFITGGNGSGKSTFVNLLTGLYTISDGAIYFNEHRISEDTFAEYSNQFSAIFTNNYLFEENYNAFDIQEENGELMEYVQMMKLQEILQINKEQGNISTALSKGQGKRLAMIYALMENRELIVLDEWAAEQDPVFRAYFYEVILARLKAMGKTVIAVTHDDHYFHHCDRLLKFDYGKISHDTKINLATKSQISAMPR
ncbi:cyclic peptide export ABC transporter [Sinomicrobium weinanense]|uniref:Cyclic peptide export ABC transporter n=1 Tax=Sinomicrobium weinanense TaxID=2842200 RepID=A0A926JQ54_9FLAO|nr:cyclic peptide export ABC transporter [Sinomicrobium weinanense]MBC9795252.1 cyclic peptide export ABC transporter [Sinomicrobium weinanense]MBU3125724.1 cyclic peptide export ABC transporter [Sinomicrobium weinanense]